MIQLKSVLMTAAILALPIGASAQISTDKMTDKVKDEAVDAVMDNMTTDDALTAGKVMIKGGSKEDAALAVAKDRAEDRAEDMLGENVTGMIGTDKMTKDGMMTAGEEMAKKKAMEVGKSYGEKTVGSATTYGKTMLPDAVPVTPGTTPVKTPATLQAPAPKKMPVSCPAGTTAQSDGTCLVTGDFNY